MIIHKRFEKKGVDFKQILSNFLEKVYEFIVVFMFAVFIFLIGAGWGISHIKTITG